jgi:peroxiredoxin Q/BCP
VREFRAHLDAFLRHGIQVACVTHESIEANRRWSERLEIRYPMLADVEGEAAHALGVNRRIGVGSWTLELARRTTLLVDVHGDVAAVWSKVRIRGHALEVLGMAKTLPAAPGPAIPDSPSPPAA